MVNQGRTTLQLPAKTVMFSPNDRVVFVYGVDSIGTTNPVAQTATISIQNLGYNLANAIQPPAPPAPIYGEITVVGNAALTTMTDQSTWYPVQATTWAFDVAPSQFSYNLALGQMTCLALSTCLTIASLSFTSPDAPATVQFGIFKNGTLIPDHTATSWTDTEVYPNTITMSGIDRISVNDVFDLRVQCKTATGVSIVATDINFSICKIG